MYKEPELQEIADLGPEPCGPDGQLCSMQTGEYGTDYVSQCPVHRAQWLKELEEYNMYEEINRQGFWVVANPEPLQLMFMIPISDDERDYLEWLDDHDKGDN